MRLIVDVGSTHCGKFEECIYAIDNAKECGIKDVKFQLLEKSMTKNSGNIYLDPTYMKELVTYGKSMGINVFASVWSKSAANVMKEAGATSVKVAHSYRHNSELINYLIKVMEFDEVIVSSDFMGPFYPFATMLYCIPMYPVPFVVSFERAFPLFSGFSDHTMGVNQTITAIQSGAQIIEKHVIQDITVDCPDSRFALDWDRIKYLQENFC